MFNDAQGTVIMNDKCDILNVCSLAVVIFLSKNMI